MAVEENISKGREAINKAIALLTGKHSYEMVERHIRAIDRVVARNKTGVLLRDLNYLCELLCVLSERMQSTSLPEYIPPICHLIELCRRPFLKEKISDENSYSADVLQALSLLGQLAMSNDHQVTSTVAKTVAAFYTEEPNRAFLEGLQMTKQTFNAVLVERSGVAKSLVEALRGVRDREAMLDLLHTIQLLSTAPTNCNHMLSRGLANLVCHVICYPDPDQQVIFTGMEILWNLLDNGSSLQVGEQLNNTECMRILKKAFHELMLSGCSKESRELRNDLLMICLRIAQLCPDAPFVETGFFNDLCVFATFAEETGSKPHLQSLADSLKQLKLTSEHEDYELKKGLMCMLTTLSSDQAAVKIMREKKVLRSFLSYVVQGDRAFGSWSFAQFEELQLLALSCLCTIAPLLIDDYMTCQGNSRILILIDWCTKEELKFRGHGNSFHGKGGRGSKLSQLRQSLRLLLSMCSTGDDGLIQDLHDQGAIPIILNLLKYTMTVPDPDGENSVLSEMQADMLLVLSCVCDMDMHRKELFGGYDGVSLLVSYLKRDIGKFEKGFGPNRLLLAAVDCVWCAVVGSPMTEDIFLESGGALVLLDLLKVCPNNMQPLILGVLVDLCENLKAIPHVSAWKGSDHSNTWSLLARLWREEEWDMEVPRGYKNTLAGSLQPLTGAQQNASGVPPIPTHCPSAAITDVSENMRAKIYALCCKMGFQYPHEELSLEDKITICIMESYLDFKSGEVWNEVAEELAQEGLRPVTPDQECLTEILHTHEEKAEETLKIQHELIDEQVGIEENEESRFYEKVKEYHQTTENAERHFQSFVERTSNYEALKEAKTRQLNSLDASRQSSVGIGDRFHSAQQQLNITTFCGRHVTVSTTPLRLLSLPIVPSSPTAQSKPATVVNN